MTTVNEMKEALLSQGGLKGVRVVVVTASLVSSEQEQSKITSVNKLNNFQYVNRNIYAGELMESGKENRSRSKVLEEVRYPAKIEHFLCLFFF